jgi:hypothetical protein
MAHQLRNLVTFDTHAHGVTARLIAGKPHLPA